MSHGGNKCGISAIKILRNKSVPLDQTGEVAGGIFGHAGPLRVAVVDVMDAESFAAAETETRQLPEAGANESNNSRVSHAPLKVVHQRPGRVAEHVDSVVDGCRSSINLHKIRIKFA